MTTVVNWDVKRQFKQTKQRGSSVVSSLAFGARGPGFDPRQRRGKFAGMTNTVRRPSDQNVLKLETPCAGTVIPWVG